VFGVISESADTKGDKVQARMEEILDFEGADHPESLADVDHLVCRACSAIHARHAR
jgi:hypothetical protein